MRSPTRWDATLTTPTAPSMADWNAVQSSPEYRSKSGGLSLTIRDIDWKSPVESFTATMFSISASRSSVSGSIRHAVRDGML